MCISKRYTSLETYQTEWYDYSVTDKAVTVLLSPTVSVISTEAQLVSAANEDISNVHLLVTREYFLVFNDPTGKIWRNLSVSGSEVTTEKGERK